MKPKLIIENLSKSFEQEVIRNISLEIFEGEIVSIIGPSGCGKSTLFNIISGILPEDNGTIIIDGKEEKSRQGKFGYMFQEPLLFPWLKTIENVMLGYKVKGFNKETARTRALKLLKEFDLFEYADFYPKALSGGMKQKGALLRTIAFNSSILLLDEPFGSLDAITRSSLHLYLLNIWKKLKLTILFTTHDIREAIFLSDRIFILSKKPASIVDCIKVNLHRPRKIKDLASPEFIKLEKKLLKLLK
jgi:ABC-type nitrate/sulfonate/bicarbonate transport system ATPase subunit